MGYAASLAGSDDCWSAHYSFDAHSQSVVRLNEEHSMQKWKVTALLGIAFGVAGIGWGYDQQAMTPGFLRTAHLHRATGQT